MLDQSQKIRLIEHDNTVVVLFSGRVSDLSVPSIRKELEELPSRHKNMVVDMSGSLYAQSSGLGVLLTVHEKLSQNGGKLYLTGLSKRMKSLFDVLGFSQLFNLSENCLESVDEALEMIQGNF